MQQSTADTISLQPARKTKVFRSQAQWKALIDEFHNSGLKKTDFCKKHRIGASSLQKWIKHFSTPSQDSSFVDITEQVIPKVDTQPSQIPTTSSWQLEIALGGGVVLRMSSR